MKLDARGTLDDLRATFDLQLTGLRSEELKGFQAGDFWIEREGREQAARGDGKLEQARIEPVQINADLPFDLAKIIEEKSV